MPKKKTPWAKALGLTSADFKERPKGFDPLIWGLKNKVVNQEEYLVWATEYYLLPAIKMEFFSMAVDFTLIDKKSHIYAWNPHCYPVYTWKGTLFVACLEPPELNTSEKVCFVMAPFFPMQNAWDKYHNSKKSTQTEQQNVAEPTQGATLLDLPDLNFDSLDDSSEPEAVTSEPTSTPETQENKEDHSVDSLDFSSLESEIKEEDSNEESEASNAAEMTHTKIDDHGLNNFTTATQTVHAPRETIVTSGETTEHKDLDFESLSTGGISLEGDPEKSEITKTKLGKPAPKLSQEPKEKQSNIAPPPPPPINEEEKKVGNSKPEIPKPPVEQQSSAPVPPPLPKEEKPDSAIPDLSDLMAHKTESPRKAPGMEQTETELKIPKHNNEEPVILKGETSSQPPAAPPAESEDFDDDYTPIPEVSESQKVAHAEKQSEKELELHEVITPHLTENTITYSDQPIHTPPEALISDKELTSADKLEDCKSLKEVISHLFSHLTRDYKKLLYVGKEDGELFYPKFVYGSWKMTSMAWRMHINLSNPNIFRIAHKSRHPFHGKVAENPFNEKYFEWWSKGKKPDFVTIFPVVMEEEIIGFITCFDKGPEFDELGSLKKIENLISICKKNLVKSKQAKAA